MKDFGALLGAIIAIWLAAFGITSGVCTALCVFGII